MDEGIVAADVNDGERRKVADGEDVVVDGE